MKPDSGHLLSVTPFGHVTWESPRKMLLEAQLVFTAAFLRLKPRVSKVQSRCFQCMQADTRTKVRKIDSTYEARLNVIKP